MLRNALLCGTRRMQGADAGGERHDHAESCLPWRRSHFDPFSIDRRALFRVWRARWGDSSSLQPARTAATRTVASEKQRDMFRL